MAGLGRSIASTGTLAEDAIGRALGALSRFRAILHVLDVKIVRAVATAACREASNGAAFLVRAEAALGLKIEILSGVEEAELAANGIFMSFESPDGIAGDLGGGSLEVIDVAGKVLKRATTLPLGCLRLEDASGGRIEKAPTITDQELGDVDWLHSGQGRAFYAVGGIWRSLARFHMANRDYPLHMMQGYAIGTGEAIDFCEQIRKAKKLTSIAGVDVVNKSRREALPYGALVLERLLKRMRPREVVFSVYGIREGIIYKLLSKQEQALDPLIAFATDTARLRARSLPHALELCNWTDAVFAPGGPAETSADRRLRHAACLLSDVAWRAHPDYRGEQSLAGIAQGALAGIDHPGRIFLAMASYFRHAGPNSEPDEVTDLPHRLMRLLPPRSLDRARLIGAAVRAAHMLSIGRPGIIDVTPIAYERDKLVLRLPTAYAALDGERTRRRFSTLASMVGKTLEVRFTT